MTTEQMGRVISGNKMENKEGWDAENNRKFTPTMKEVREAQRAVEAKVGGRCQLSSKGNGPKGNGDWILKIPGDYAKKNGIAKFFTVSDPRDALKVLDKAIEKASEKN